jgi:hypothetical protein
MSLPTNLWDLRPRRVNSTTAALLVCAALAADLPAAEVKVVPLVGDAQEGELRELSLSRVVVATTAGEQSLDPKGIQSVQFDRLGSVEKPAVWLELVDGSQLAATSYQAAAGKAQVELLGRLKLEIPTRSIRFVRYRQHQGELARQWNEMLRSQPTGDLLVKRNKTSRTVEEPGQEPKTVEEESLDQIEGAVLEVGAATAKFDFDGDVIDVKLERIDGIIYFHPAGRELPPAACQVTDAHQSVWAARTVELKANRLSVVTSAGVAIEIPAEDLLQVDFSAGNVRFLADLDSETDLAESSFQPRNMTATFRQLKLPRKNRPFGSDALSIGGKRYERGVALSGRTRISYRVPEGMKWFRAEAGLDDLAGPAASLTLRILADGRELFQRAFSADESRAPFSIELDVSHVRRLTFVVEDASGLDIADQLDLAEARLTK